ncbi:MAG: substrate-binding domain-containing protein [Aquisalinus sp.]|nr:substrate-binding domain-containing protein [Aquisalinus sp.]
MIRILFTSLISAAAVLKSAVAMDMSGDEVIIVGSSTVTPFGQAVVERVNTDGAQRLVIDTTGTSGGISLFCRSETISFAPILLASRAMTEEEMKACSVQLADEIREYKVGLSGIVLAEKAGNRPLKLTTSHIYRALAAFLPSSDEDCVFVSNKNETWHDIDPALPKRPIQVFGPPATSGTRGSFLSLAMEHGALQDTCIQVLKARDKEHFYRVVHDLRVDGAWIDAGENNHTIIAAISGIPDAVGILGYADVAAYSDIITSLTINGVSPNLSTIASGDYALSRFLRFYTKLGAEKNNTLVSEFVAEMTSQEAIGASGYLVDQGLISLDSMSMETAVLDLSN